MASKDRHVFPEPTRVASSGFAYRHTVGSSWPDERRFRIPCAPKQTTQKCEDNEHRSICAVRNGTRLEAQRFVERLSSPQACPQCWSHRTRRLGPADSIYYRCEACEYAFRPRDQGTEESPRVPVETPYVCPKCGDDRTRIVGQSGAPALVHRCCQVCGHVWSRGLDARGAPR
jgi:hypothetical protein